MSHSIKMKGLRRFEKEKESLKKYNPEFEFNNKRLSNVILNGKYYRFKIIPDDSYPLGKFKFEIQIPKKVEMFARFGKKILLKYGLSEDCINKIIEMIFNDLIEKKGKYSLEYKEFINSKKYLLDYGKSSEAVFDYDDLMILSPKNMLGDYIKIYLDLCKKYSYSFDFINNFEL